MKREFTKNLAVLTLAAAAVCGAGTAQAQTEKLYLSDVATEAQLTSDVFGVPMRIDNVGANLYEARYYNQVANNKIYILSNKTSFEDAYGLIDGELCMGKAFDDIEPIVLPEAGKYYLIKLNVDDMEYSVETYEVKDYMDPVFYELGSYNLNNWWAWKDTGTDDWMPADDAWMREFYFGYTCTEYLMNDNGEYVDAEGNVVAYDKEAGTDERVMAKKMNPAGQEVDAEQLRWCEPWEQDANNPHLYTWTTPKHFVGGQKLNFIIHNWHEHGWWNYCTWRVDDGAECDIFYYYGGVVKQAYLDWVYGAGNVSWKDWSDDEGFRKRTIYGEGNDSWCSPTVPATGEYVMQFDTHLGRAKIVPADEIASGVQEIGTTVEATGTGVEYYNIQGMRVNGENLPAGLYIKREGSKTSKVLVK